MSAGADPTIPSQFESDPLTKYELGMRPSLADRRLLLDGTPYWVDWKDIQVSQRATSGLVFTANAGRARNRGFELSATVLPAAGLSLRGR